MTATIALPRQPHSDWLARIRTVGLGLGGRGVMGLGLGRSSVQAAEASWWLSGGISAANAIAVYQPKGAASLAASYTNLAHPGTYDAAPGTAPTFATATGWTFASASSQWLETGIAPVNNQAWSGIARFSNFTGGSGNTGCFFGLVQACRFAVTQTNAINRVYQNGSFRAPAVVVAASGVIGVAGNQGYFNGAAEGLTIPSAAGSFSSTIAIGQTKESGFNFYLDGYIQALAIYSATLTAPQVAAVSSAMSLL